MPTSTARVPKMPKKELEKYRRQLIEKKSSLMSELAKTKNAEEETTEEATQDNATQRTFAARDGWCSFKGWRCGKRR